MGCISSKTHTLIVDYEGTKKEKAGGYTDYLQARKWISNEFPHLRSQAFLLQTMDKPPMTIKNSQDFTNALRLNPKVLKLKITLERPQILSTDPISKLSQAVVKIKNAAGHIEGTGVLISETLLLASSEILKDDLCLENYSVMFYDSRSTTVPFDLNRFYHKFGVNEENYFALAQLSWCRQLDVLLHDVKPVPLELEPSSRRGTKADILYYLKTNPSLNRRTVGYNIERDKISLGDILLGEGAQGAPIFDENCKLLGFFSTKINAGISVKAVTEELKKLYKKGNHGVDDQIEYAFKNSNLDLPEQDFQLPEEEPTNLYLESACYLDYKNESLNYQHFTETKIRKIYNCPADKGSCAVVTPIGIIITGKSLSGDTNKAWIYDNAFSELPNTYDSHEYHCSVMHDSSLYVISGRNSMSIEIFDLSKRQWTRLTNFSKNLYKASCTSINRRIYICGGIKGEKISHSIYSLEGRQLIKHAFKMPAFIYGGGLLNLSSNLVIYFGGVIGLEDTYKEKNLKSFMINIDNGSILEGKNLEESMEFYTIQPYYRKKEAIIFSTKGKLLRYDIKKAKFFYFSIQLEEAEDYSVD
ncbi:unnamed protein product [Blepharisma stoltei]|uniref:Uncharacterized protein n=1 Tax=Blepharisma stoltei TaxID=1481888 RepID=A0AAU9JBH8_9CILI|nr:unnamed protein product [Blepharisma stoltei]